MSQQVPFREQALQHYNQQSQPTVLLRFVSLRFTAFLWTVLMLCVGAAFAAWLVPIPSYASVSGVVQPQPGAGIVLFVPASQKAQVHQGTPAQIQLGATGPQFSASVVAVETGVMSPQEARQHYGLGSDVWGVVTEPSIAVIIPLPSVFALSTYAGSVITAQVQVGSRPILSLLPGLSSLTGGSNG